MVTPLKVNIPLNPPWKVGPRGPALWTPDGLTSKMQRRSYWRLMRCSKSLAGLTLRTARPCYLDVRLTNVRAAQARYTFRMADRSLSSLAGHASCSRVKVSLSAASAASSLTGPKEQRLQAWALRAHLTTGPRSNQQPQAQSLRTRTK